jgi:chlorobactene glucosyltransferase
MNLLLQAAPWLAFPLLVPWLLRRRPNLRDCTTTTGELPLVSIIVPARNEALNIGACLGSLLGSNYPNKEIIVVDDGSTDATGDIARALAEQTGSNLRVIDAGPLPDGWLGKSWACWTGYQHAQGELVLFTDADTRHGEALLAMAVGALQQMQASLISLLPRQLMESFWERVVLPHVFLSISLRYASANRVNRTRNPRQVLANGQFLLFDRSRYEQVGGHAAVRGEVVEDVALAQRLVGHGQRAILLHAHQDMETRMYRSLPGIIEGWSKNLARGVHLSLSPALANLVLWLAVPINLTLWVVPPFLLLASLFLDTGAALRAWAALASGGALLGWSYTHLHMRSGLSAAFLFPVGSLMASYIVARSALRGRHVEWRGRRYEVEPI